jgi:hypothetical protein
MAIYLNKESEKVLSLSDEDFYEMELNENMLLELEHDGIGWTIKKSKANIVKVNNYES